MKKIIEKITDAWENDSVVLMILVTIGLIALNYGLMCLQAWFVMLLWNWIAAGLFGAPVLNFWMAFGLWFLCSLLFKNKMIVNNKSK